MLQFPAFMTQYPSPASMVSSSVLMPWQWPPPQSEELQLDLEESELESKLMEIRKANTNMVVIGKATVDNDKEDFDNDVDDEDADNAEESDGDEFEQETG
ncbi:hypothetical protein Scep_021191 [Stephania cephalantha]|uniref:Uncharacterized protein n=1 Tax=Stephania cephalantha TaxID=152367 RepID=A0AAP0F5N6_9MAGN